MFFFWVYLIKQFIRDLFFFSLIKDEFHPYSVIFVVFFVPPITLLFQPFRKIISKLYPLLYIISFFCFSLTIVKELYFRTIFQMFCVLLSFIWFDIRLQDRNISVRKRFITAQLFAIYVSSALKFVGIGYIPFYYQYYGIIYIIFGLFCLIYICFEEIFLNFTKRGSKIQEKLNFELNEEKYPVQKEKKKIKIYYRVLKLVCTIISIIFWGLGYSFIIYLQRYVISPNLTMAFIGYNCSLGILIIISYSTGIIISYFNFSKSPIFFILVTTPSVLIFSLSSNKMTLMFFSLLMVLTFPSLFKFFLHEYRFIYGNFYGGIGISSCFYVFILFCEISTILNGKIHPLDYIFGLRPYSISIFGIILLFISYFSFILNRVYFIFKSLNRKNTIQCLFWSFFLVFLYPHYFSRETLKKIPKQKDFNEKIEITLSEKRLLKEILNEHSSDSSNSEMDDENEDPTLGERKNSKIKKVEELKFFFSKLTQIEKCGFSLKISMIFIFALFFLIVVSLFIVRNSYIVKNFHQDKFIRIATYNIYQGYTYHGGDNGKFILDFLLDKKIDCVGLQETNTEMIYNGYQSIIDYLGINFESYFYHGARIPSIGAAFISKFEVINFKSEVFPEIPSGFLRPIISTEIVFNNTVIHFKTVHLDFDHHAEEQTEYLLKMVRGMKNIVLLGDFNRKPNTTAYQRIIEEGFVDAFFDYNGFRNITVMSGKTIDYVFIKGDFNILNAKIYETTISDHFPVVVDLEINKKG